MIEDETVPAEITAVEEEEAFVAEEVSATETSEEVSEVTGTEAPIEE